MQFRVINMKLFYRINRNTHINSVEPIVVAPTVPGIIEKFARNDDGHHFFRV